MCEEANLKDTDSTISSRESPDGPMPLNLRDGRKTGRSGREAVHASPSRQPESAEEPKTPATYGPLFSASSPSIDLQKSLESRLRVRLDVNGSPEYVLTWKHWDMPSGVPICALRASAPRTSGKGFGGLRTPKTPTGGGNPKVDPQHMHRLDDAALLAGWGTPRVTTGKYCYSSGDHSKPVLTLEGQAHLAGWPTCSARDYKSEEASDEFNEKRWSHPRGKLLSAVASLASGLTTNSSSAPTEKRGALNPELARWLQGFPAEWLSCVDWETLSSRRSPRSSSKRI